MHKRIVFCVSTVLFALLALVAALVADLHDREFPEQLQVTSSVNLDFSTSGTPDAEAFQWLSVLSDDLDLGLVKVAPDLSGRSSGQVFVVVGTQHDLPRTIRRFGDEADAEVRGSAALRHSYASGDYFITGAAPSLTRFREELTTHGVGQEWSDNSLGSALVFLVRQGNFASSVLAAIALMSSLVLYWLSVKARGRAVRVLAGVRPWRIQTEDLMGFTAAMLPAAVVCGAVAVSFVGLTQGLKFVPYYAWALFTFYSVVIVATAVGAVGISLTSSPSTKLLAARRPAVANLRSATVMLQAVTFTMVLAAVAPAYATYAESSKAAAQQAQWKALSDQVALSFRATSESDFQRLTRQVGEVIKAAEKQNAVALSYTWDDNEIAGVDLGSYDAMSVVNQRWLDLMLGHKLTKTVLQPLGFDEVPPEARTFLSEGLPLWSREKLSKTEVLSRISFYRSSGTAPIPVASGGGGDLLFPDHAVVAVVPGLHAMFNDDFLASVSTSKNLVLTGLGPTQALLAQQGIQRMVQVKHVAEEGVLRAQLSAYFAWLHGVSLLALIIALLVAASLSAFINAVLRARRDFPLRLAGRRWRDILAARVSKEALAAAALTALVLGVRGSEASLLVVTVATVMVLLLPVMHLTAARRTFAHVSSRKL